MIYGILLALHSLTRWLVLSGLLVSIVRSGRGWAGGSAFTRADNAFRHWTTTAAHVQLVLGVWLYFVSPITAFFMNNFSEAVHVRDVRFFGMEHSLIMTVAVVLVTIGSARARRKKNDREKHKTVFAWYTIALLLIITSVPWPFSPFTARPWFRPF